MDVIINDLIQELKEKEKEEEKLKTLENVKLETWWELPSVRGTGQKLAGEKKYRWIESGQNNF